MSSAEAMHSAEADKSFTNSIVVFVNPFSVEEMRTKGTFGITVRDNWKVYASLKEHARVRADHKIPTDKIDYEGRTQRIGNTIRVFLTSGLYPTITPHDGIVFGQFKKALLEKLQKAIDPKSELTWEYGIGSV